MLNISPLPRSWTRSVCADVPDLRAKNQSIPALPYSVSVTPSSNSSWKLLWAAHVLQTQLNPAAHSLSAAQDVAQAVATHILSTHGPDWLPSGAELPQLAELIARLRPLAQMAVDAYNGQVRRMNIRYRRTGLYRENPRQPVES